MSESTNRQNQEKGDLVNPWLTPEIIIDLAWKLLISIGIIYTFFKIDNVNSIVSNKNQHNEIVSRKIFLINNAMNTKDPIEIGLNFKILEKTLEKDDELWLNQLDTLFKQKQEYLEAKNLLETAIKTIELELQKSNSESNNKELIKKLKLLKSQQIEL